MDVEPNSRLHCHAAVRVYTGKMFPSYVACSRWGVVKDGEKRYCTQHAKRLGIVIPKCLRCGRAVPAHRVATSDYCTDKCAREQHKADEASAASERAAQEEN